MKSTFLFVLAVFTVISANCQFKYDQWGNIVPFGRSEKYAKSISEKRLSDIVLPAYNNDSLFRMHNNGKSISEVGSAFVGAIPIETTMNIKKDGTKVEIKEGTLWIFEVSTKTAESLNLKIRKFNIPDGAYLSFYSVQYPDQDPTTFTKESVQKRNREPRWYSSTNFGDVVRIEYFESSGSTSNEEIILYNIDYIFAGLRPTQQFHYKGGGFVDDNDPILGCQEDITCPQHQTRLSDGNCVGYIRIPFPLNGQTAYSTGTVFFLNKTGDYDSDDYPYFVSCGHLFGPEHNSVVHDIASTYHWEDVEVRVNYLNPTCASTKRVWGRKIGKVSNLLIGTDYINPIANHSQDYSFWTAETEVNKLAQFGVYYAPWSYAGFVTSSTPFYALGHPKNDVMKILIDEQNASLYPPYDHFTLKFDVGVNEKGCSGSPVFSNSGFVHGWITGNSVTYAPICENRSDIVTNCGMIREIYNEIAPYLDENYIGHATSYFPTFSEPLHCSNCVTDENETAMDCGGSCGPCGSPIFANIRSDIDFINDQEAVARDNIIIDPIDENSLFGIVPDFGEEDPTYSFRAGYSIIIRQGTVFPASKQISLEVDTELFYEDERKCGEYCFAAANVFSPSNNDGLNDFYGITQASMTSFSYKVLAYIGRRWELVHYEDDIPVFSNGGIYFWDGTGVTVPPGGHVLCKLIFQTIDCNGNAHEHTVYNVYVW